MDNRCNYQNENVTKKQILGSRGMLLGTLDDSLLVNMLPRKRTMTLCEGWGVVRDEDGIV